LNANGFAKGSTRIALVGSAILPADEKALGGSE
jgi:hypothetical protein